ncbi:general transcription factor 3C polypeptide 1-like isoform X2 [Homarus americanus]|uniref:general transcription factor 3C polypeptide 1-like isoform X2 n=1 Tax=Homarus americanus TaxID=6706 RepID=UPI001C4879EF|nr:general transcription factor 3C polypeptide 1-like isoform X2 [Homarus americanus]
MVSLNMNYIADLEDEIALEGLDGITVDGLWVRLKQRTNFETNMPLDDNSKAFLWSIAADDDEISIYQLPSPRDELVIFNRYEHMDPELGIVLEPEKEPKDIYPFHPVDDKKKGVRGSCKTYNERVDITHQAASMTLQEVLKEYGQRLVLVASQMLRNKALYISTCIDKFYDLTLTQYIIVERIGRSRRMGEITQGKVSLASMGENPKSMFYHRKRLLKLNLITKQPHQQKGTKGQTHNGSLLHLTRFYVERRSKFIMMIQRAVEILKSKPNNCAPYTMVKEEMGMPETSCRKLFKSTEFQRYIKNITAPYRKMYPDAPPSQWRCKGKDAEKFVRIMELLNPMIDPLEVCKVDEVADEEEDDDSYPGILDQHRVVWGVGLLQQAYEAVEQAGPDGVSQSDMARLLGQTKLDSRTICRNLQRRNTVHSLMKDVWRQRVSRYVSHKYARTGHLTQEFRKERQKMMAMMKQDQAEINKPSTSKEGEVSRVLESNYLEGVEVDLEMLTSEKRNDKEPVASTSKDSTPSVSVWDPQQSDSKKNTSGNDSNNKGFLTMLEEIRLTYSNQKRNSPHVTTRMMKRANMIIEAVRSIKVIDDAFKLQKMIVQAESEEGYAVKMDKKSLNRLLDKLSKGGFLKNIIVKLKCATLEKSVRFVVHPSITFESPHLKSAIEQQKLKLLAVGSEPKREGERGSAEGKQEARKIKSEDKSSRSAKDRETEEDTDGPMNKSSVGESMQELKRMHQISSSKNPSPSSHVVSTGTVVKKVAGVKGSLGPKFVRMCELHKLLYYLVYGYGGQEDIEQEEAWTTIAASSPEVQLQNEDLTSYPTIYFAELSWKMFIPPLPNHMNTEKGWAFVCDVLLRLPLCIFVRLVSVSYTSGEIEEYLSHPLKRNLLVKYLPPHLRQSLLQGRRYVTYVIDLINRLCYVGLLQYGHQIMKEKDQVFIYVNRKASLIDTTTSSPGYHQISADKEYVRKEYYFTYLQDVLQYWYDMWTISMHTPLGGHNCMQGKKITIQILDRKPQIIESLKPRNTYEAPARDIGSIPGDGRGAGGLDSAMFAHLKRNWSSTSGHAAAARPSALLPPSTDGGERATYEGTMSYTQYLMNTTNPSSGTLSPKHRLAGLRNVKLSVYKPRMGTDGKALEIPVALVTQPSQGRKRKRGGSQSSDSDTPPTKPTRTSGQKRNRPTSYQRELKMRKKSPKKPYYDEEDRAALRRMNKLRVDWSSAEDSFLLLCKVASCFLFPNIRSQMITFSLVRDLLHERFPEARNKTSRACQRRINYIMKNPTTEDNVAIFLEEVRQDAKIVAEFKGPRLPRNKKNIENVYAKMFRRLMIRLVVKFASSESRQCPDLPDTAKEFEQRYCIIMASSSLRSKLKVKEVTSVSEIDFFVVNALIYSSLCSKYDRDSYAYQLYLAYQQYPQALLNNVLTCMRHDQMISFKKCYNRSQFAQTCLPLSTSPFQLSVTYLHVFNFKYQYEIFSQSWQMLKQLLEKKRQIMLKEKTSGTVRSDPKGGEYVENVGEDGVPVVILHEGGYCATIVALMATKRLIFDIVIPEQIIMMDQHQPIMEDHQQSLLRRFSSHTQMSGRDIKDIDGPFLDYVNAPSPSSSNTLIGGDVTAKTKGTHVVKERLKDLKESQALVDGKSKTKEPVKRKAIGKDQDKVKKSKQGQNTPEKMETVSTPPPQDVRRPTRSCRKSTRDAEQVKSEPDSAEKGLPVKKTTPGAAAEKAGQLMKMKQEALEEPALEEDNEDTQDTEDSCQPGDASSTEEDLDVSCPQGRGSQSSASRLGLYMMRDQLTLAEVDQINIQHAQEHLVVNACEITCRLRPPPVMQDEFDAAASKDSDVTDNFLLPLPKKIIAEALEHRKKVTLEDWCLLEDVLKKWEEDGESQELLDMVVEVYQYINSCKDIGASINNLKEIFEDRPFSITGVVAMMEKTLLVLRVGVAVVRWVTMPYTKPWLIHTNKITRVHRQSVRLQGVYRMNLKNGDKGTNSQDKENATEVSEDDGHTVEQEGGTADRETTSPHLHPDQSNPEQTSSTLPADEASSDLPEVNVAETHDLAEQAVKGEASSLPTVTSTSLDDNADTTISSDGVHKTAAMDESVMKTDHPTPSISTSDTTNKTVDDPLEASSSSQLMDGNDIFLPASRRSRRISLKSYKTKEGGGGGQIDEGNSIRHIHSFMAMRKRKYRRDEEVSKKMEKTIKHHQNVTDYEEISVAVRPWVRLNGTLNRRVLDRLLGAVLSLIMERPGISGRDIVCRFSPALQPAHTHDLLETLVHLHCIVREHLIPSHKPSLFSDTVDYILVQAEIHDCDDELLYEPTVDAILKLAMFIGDKKYTQDFLSGDR